MIQSGDRAGLGQETLQGRAVLADFAGDDLQRHLAVHGHVLAEEHAAHAAAAQQLDQLVLAQKEGRPPGQQLPRLPARDEAQFGQGPGEIGRIGRPAFRPPIGGPAATARG